MDVVLHKAKHSPVRHCVARGVWPKYCASQFCPTGWSGLDEVIVAVPCVRFVWGAGPGGGTAQCTSIGNGFVKSLFVDQKF